MLKVGTFSVSCSLVHPIVYCPVNYTNSYFIILVLFLFGDTGYPYDNECYDYCYNLGFLTLNNCNRDYNVCLRRENTIVFIFRIYGMTLNNFEELKISVNYFTVKCQLCFLSIKQFCILFLKSLNKL